MKTELNIKVNVNNLKEFYDKAKKSFDKCITQNQDLQNEIDGLLSDIILIEDKINISFNELYIDDFFYEISLLLSLGDERIGKYKLYLNSNYTEVDDSLVFW